MDGIIRRYCMLFGAVFILFIPGLSAEEKSTDESVPNIGSIDDSGRVDVDTFEFSNTEYKLWIDKHLLNINKPARLHYTFTRSGSYEKSFSDDVYLDIIKLNQDESRDTSLDFFSAQRKQNISRENVQNVSSNPVIGAYMQGDTYEMQRLTGGHWRYFLKQIKLVMADTNESESISVEFDEKKYDSEKITFLPFENIDDKERLGKFVDKTYEFTFSDKIPGKLYSIKTIIKDMDNPTGEPLIAEELILRSITFSL